MNTIYASQKINYLRGLSFRLSAKLRHSKVTDTVKERVTRQRQILQCAASMYRAMDKIEESRVYDNLARVQIFSKNNMINAPIGNNLSDPLSMLQMLRECPGSEVRESLIRDFDLLHINHQHSLSHYKVMLEVSALKLIPTHMPLPQVSNY